MSEKRTPQQTSQQHWPYFTKTEMVGVTLGDLVDLACLQDSTDRNVLVDKLISRHVEATKQMPAPTTQPKFQPRRQPALFAVTPRKWRFMQILWWAQVTTWASFLVYIVLKLIASTP